jgi:hypothetical protein
MKIRDTQFKYPPFDVATPLAEFLISTGKFSANPVEAAPPIVVTFGLLQDDIATPPAITHRCSGCGLTGYTSSEKGTAHLTPILHCRMSSLPGPDIADAYVKAFKAYSRRPKDEPKSETEKPKRVFFTTALGAR